MVSYLFYMDFYGLFLLLGFHCVSGISRLYYLDHFTSASHMQTLLSIGTTLVISYAPRGGHMYNIIASSFECLTPLF